MSEEIEEKQKDERSKKRTKKNKREFNRAEFWTKVMALALVLIMVGATCATLIFSLI